MKKQVVAESIILQALDDLWQPKYRAESLDFFASSEFISLAESAGISKKRIVELLDMVYQMNRNITRLDVSARTKMAGRVNISPNSLSAPSHLR